MTRHRSALCGALSLAALGAALGSCAQPGGAGSSGQVVRISQQVWTYYEEYVGRERPLYFAVSIDGNYAASNYCAHQRCVDELGAGRQDALARCEDLSKQDCMIFAHDGRIQIPYEIKP